MDLIESLVNSKFDVTKHQQMDLFDLKIAHYEYWCCRQGNFHLFDFKPCTIQIVEVLTD